MRNGVLVLGTLALDTVHTPSGVKKDILGGSAAHFAMAARLFGPVHMVAVIGEDFPKRHLTLLKRRGVDCSSVSVGAGKTFRWHGRYEARDMNTALTLATELGVLAAFQPEVAGHHRHTPFVFLANIDPDIQAGLLNLLKKPRFIGLDSMNLWIQHKKKSLLSVMKRVDLFVLNEAEAKSLSGEAHVIKAAKRLRRMGPRMVVVKKGEHGALFVSDAVSAVFPAYPVDHVVDPTGAGDTFAGGLMGYLAAQRRITPTVIKHALLYGITLASFNVEGFGLMKTARLDRAAVNRRLRQLQKLFSLD